MEGGIGIASRRLGRTFGLAAAALMFYVARNLHLYGRREPASLLYKELCLNYPKSPYVARSLLFSGIVSIEAGESGDAAVAKLSEFIAANPESPWASTARYWLGRAYENAGDLARARDAYESADADPVVNAAYRLANLAGP